MDVIRLVQFVQKTIKGRRQSVREILENNGVQSMEQYISRWGTPNDCGTYWEVGAARTKILAFCMKFRP